MSDRTSIPAVDGVLRGATVSLLEAGATFSLRLAPQLAEVVREAVGFDLTGGINTLITSGPKISARLGPDEWLLTAPESPSDALAGEIEAALAGHFHSLVDVSHRNVAIAVQGPMTPVVLSAGVAIDLDDAVFPPGSATRTLLGKAEIVLMRTGGDHTYRVECWRSFAPYVRGFIEEAARELHTF